RAARLAPVLEHLPPRPPLQLVEVGAILIALRLPREPVGVRQHAFALTGEIPLALGADPLALGRTDRARELKALMVQRERVTGLGVLVDVDAKPHGDPLTHARRRGL